MGVPLGDLFDTLQIYLGSLYVNDFNLYGRTWQVIVQADAPFRIQKETVGQLKVRNSSRRHGARGDPGLDQGRQRPLAHQPLQHPRGGLHQRRHRAGNQLPAGNRPDGRAGRQGIAQGHGLRVDRDGVLRGAGGQHGDGHLRRGRVDGLPGAGRAVRELVAALGGDPRGSHVPVVRDRRRLGDAPALAQVAGRAAARRTSTSSRRSASWCWWGWPARTRS